MVVDNLKAGEKYDIILRSTEANNQLSEFKTKLPNVQTGNHNYMLMKLIKHSNFQLSTNLNKIT